MKPLTYSVIDNDGNVVERTIPQSQLKNNKKNYQILMVIGLTVVTLSVLTVIADRQTTRNQREYYENHKTEIDRKAAKEAADREEERKALELRALELKIQKAEKEFDKKAERSNQ